MTTKSQTQTKKPLMVELPGSQDGLTPARIIPVEPRDDVQVPDTPPEERADVVAVIHEVPQVLNARLRHVGMADGKDIPEPDIERHEAERFWIDVLELPRLLELGAVKEVSVLEAEQAHREKQAALEAEHLANEGELDERIAKLRAENDAQVRETEKGLTCRPLRKKHGVTDDFPSSPGGWRARAASRACTSAVSEVRSRRR
jgi:hypothetical protein